MENQGGYIPEHINERWQEVADALTQTALERHAVEVEYREAVAARVNGLEDMAPNLQSSQLLAERLSQVNQRYTGLIMARLSLSQELKQWQMQTYFSDRAA